MAHFNNVISVVLLSIIALLLSTTATATVVAYRRGEELVTVRTAAKNDQAEAIAARTQADASTVRLKAIQLEFDDFKKRIEVLRLIDVSKLAKDHDDELVERDGRIARLNQKVADLEMKLNEKMK